MHTTEVGVSNVPAFLVKLWKLVEDEKCNDLISWSSNGQSFIIHNQTQFAKELLPLYFKHNNMASLIRQLNMYGFRKVANIDQGLRSDREGIEFFHSCFIRGQECLLEYIKRKVPSSRGGAVVPDDGRARSEVFKELLSDVGSMQGRQEQMDQLLADMKKENGALWREVARLRQEHLKQQQIVEKLIQFLITMVQANRNITVKRKIPLMLHDSPSTRAKMPRLAKNAFIADYHVSSPAGSQVSEGPVIHDVTDLMEDLSETSAIVGDLVTPAQSPKTIEESAPVTPVRLIPSAAFNYLDSSPIVASPLSATEAIEPLCLLDPLQDEEGSYVLPCGIEEVVIDSSDDRPREPTAPSSKSLVVPNEKALQVVTSPSTADKQVMSANSQASNGASDLLSSCIMLEDIPTLEGEVEPPETASPLGLADLATEASSKHKKEKAVAPRSPGMQVALHDKAAGAAKVFSEHVESIDSDLDWLQDQLMSGGLNLDTSTLMGVCPDWTGLLSKASKLFSPEDPLTSCLGLIGRERNKASIQEKKLPTEFIVNAKDELELKSFMQEGDERRMPFTELVEDLATESSSISDTVGNEVVQYTPSLLDLGIEDDTSFQPVSELLLPDDELPSSSSMPANIESVSRPGFLVASEKSLSLQSASPSHLQPDSAKLAQTVPHLVGKKGSMPSKKRRGNSKK
ncbi:heat shock factor protein isoform X3 [Rhipicephalus sanguineus]|uniref:heat shock factor protein isoform X3 n=1 Tax=Rhipicephalus sanguineus TaxID=34632 RepID=UPI0020C26903|nr:heat shock factor protein isoform X3 [Rhipicephalus sanguineus]